MSLASNDQSQPTDATVEVVSAQGKQLRKFVIVAGTWEFDGNDTDSEWWMPKSPFVVFMEQNGWEYVKEGNDPFVWTTALTGVSPLTWFGKKNNHATWRAAAKNLKLYLSQIPLKDRNVIAHSHGGQVAAYCAAEGTKINNLLTLSTPMRKDMEAVYTRAKTNIGYWTHVHSDWTDYMQLLGSFFDGRFGIHRSCEAADVNVTIKGVGHSKIIRDPAYFKAWLDYKLLDYIAKAEDVTITTEHKEPTNV